MPFRLCLRAGFLAALASNLLAQGSLTPPGAPASSMRSLAQIAIVGTEINSINTPGNASAVYVLNSAGRYFLARSVTVAAPGQHVILIQGSGITVDFNGCSIIGIGTLSGVYDGGLNRGNVTVCNGTITGCTNGVDLRASFNCRLHNLTCANNSGIGFNVGDAVEMRDCTSRDNSDDGISTGFNANLLHCTAVGSVNGHGFDLGKDSAAYACVANFNKLNGFNTAASCAVSYSSSHQNQGSGFVTSSACALIGCQATENSGSAILTGTSCTLQACTAYLNGTAASTTYAIFTNVGCTVTGCTSSFNNVQYGIVANNGCTVSHCSAYSNTSAQSISAGFFVGQASLRHCTANANTNTNATATNTTGMGVYSNGANALVEHCLCANNKGDGIYMVGSGASVRNNVCSDNTNAGIHLNSSGNRVEGNQLVSNSGSGLLIDTPVSFVTGNTARANGTNYSIVANNRVATIVTPALSASISGSTGGTAVSTDAFANISY